MVALYSALDTCVMVDSDSRSDSGSVVGLSCAWLGWLLGLGSGGKCSALALAYCNSVLAFDDGAGAAGDAQGLESVPGDALVRTLYLRNLRGAQWGYQLCPFVRLFRHRCLFPHLPGRGRSLLHRTLPLPLA